MGLLVTALKVESHFSRFKNEKKKYFLIPFPLEFLDFWEKLRTGNKDIGSPPNLELHQQKLGTFHEQYGPKNT